MKISNAIKNSILILLVIIIGHFFLKYKYNKELFLQQDTTCKVNLNNKENDINKKIKANCDIIQDKKDFLILNEYEDENPMNSGKINESLSAFDKYDFII